MGRKKKEPQYVFIDRPLDQNIGQADRALRGLLSSIFFTRSGSHHGLRRVINTLLGCTMGISALTGRSSLYKNLEIDTTDCASWKSVREWLNKAN